MNEIARYFDSRADDWEKTFNRPSAVQGAVAAIAGIGPGSRVLDLGCGTGIMADVYLTLGVSQVVALDIAPRMIEIAQKKYENEPRIDFRCRDAVEFEDEEGFDAVVIYNAYPHFLDKDALAKRVASLVKPAGRFTVAHSMGRAQMNDHHRNVPASVTSVLRPAVEEAEAWRDWFKIDSIVDSPFFYCFAGQLK